MAPSLRDIPGAKQPRRRFAANRDVFTPSRSPLLDLTPRGLGLDRGRRRHFAPSRQIDVGIWFLILGALAVAVWLGTSFWKATRVEASMTGLTSGAQLTPDAAADLDVRLTMPSSDERFRADITVDGVELTEDLEFRGDTLRLRPAQLVESELVEGALDDGEHEIEVSVTRLFLGDSTFRWTYVVDGVAPRLEVPRSHDPVAIDAEVTVSGEVDPDAELFFQGEPLDHDDGRFSVDFDFPPAGALRFEAVDEAGNRTTTTSGVPVVYPSESRAVHVSAAAWGNEPLRAGVLDLLDRGLIDTVELDLKDESGVVGYDSELETARRIGAVKPEYELAETVATLEEHGARVIGRIVAFRDPIYAQAAWDAGEHDQVLQAPDGEMLSAYGGFTNYVHPAVRKYNLDIALEAVEAGVHDILWDYIRRPEGHPSTMVVPGLDGPSSVVVAEFLAESHDALRERGAYQGASVFGIAAVHGDSIAQDIPTMARVVDYLAPMLYPSHWGPGQFGVPSPINEPYEITYRSLAEFQHIAEGTGVRFLPWMQDFDLAGVAYGPAEVRAQIDAARALGVNGFILWNAQVRYTPEALDPIP
jgi:hypothetical protein